MRSQSSAHARKLHWHSNDVPAEPRWLVKKILPASGVALMSGLYSTGKTFMALHLAHCVSTEQSFAGKKVKRRGGTLLLAAEADGDTPIRLRAIATSRPTGKQDPLPFAWIDAVPKLSEPGAINKLLATAREAAVGMKEKFDLPLVLIVVDTMSAAAEFEDENSAAQVQPVMDVLHQLARETDTLVMVVDHFGKAVNAGDTWEHR